MAPPLSHVLLFFHGCRALLSQIFQNALRNVILQVFLLPFINKLFQLLCILLKLMVVHFRQKIQEVDSLEPKKMWLNFVHGTISNRRIIDQELLFLAFVAQFDSMEVHVSNVFLEFYQDVC